MSPAERVIMLLQSDIRRLKAKGYAMRRLGYGELLLLSQNPELFRTLQMELDPLDRQYIERKI